MGGNISHKKARKQLGVPVTGSTSPDQFFSQFRVRLTGNDYKGHQYLCLSGFEIWGVIRSREMMKCSQSWRRAVMKVSPSFVVWAIGCSRNRRNWKLTTLKNSKNILALIVNFLIDNHNSLLFAKTSPVNSFGTDGILYALGTDFGSRKWSNPVGRASGKKEASPNSRKGKYLTVARSPFGSGWGCLGDVAAFVGRTSAHSHTKNAMGSWYSISLHEHCVAPQNYALMCYGPGGGFLPYNWDLEASNDGNNWVQLSRHVKCRDILSEGKIHTWPIHMKQEHQDLNGKHHSMTHNKKI